MEARGGSGGSDGKEAGGADPYQRKATGIATRSTRRTGNQGMLRSNEINSGSTKPLDRRTTREREEEEQREGRGKPVARHRTGPSRLWLPTEEPQSAKGTGRRREIKEAKRANITGH